VSCGEIDFLDMMMMRRRRRRRITGS